MNELKEIIKKNTEKVGMVIALVAIVLIFSLLTYGVLLTPLNVTNIIMQNSYVIILAIGMVLVILTGEIDLSVGSVAAFIGALSGVLMISWGWSPYVAVPIALIVGGLIGAWHGFWVAYIELPAFIVTLAGMLLFRGLTMITLDGRTLAPFPEAFRVISSSYLPDLLNGGTYHLLTIVLGIIAVGVYLYMEIRARNKQKELNQTVETDKLFYAKILLISIAVLAFIERLAAYEGVPYILLVLLVLIFGYSFFTKRTISGRHIYAVGGNENAAALSGVKTKKVKFWVYVNNGVMSALAGLVFTGRLNAATPQAGQLFELDAIAAAVIGGASMTGGIGTIVGAVIGALIMGILDNGMSILGVGIDWQQAIKALVLLGAVAFDIINKKRSK
ncbi:sugar ABC transporter permease protein [Tetragenococcus halophilus subsp. halophilus]|uniref:Xylose transport system permease protein XylH n=1 Tax=Tetragenococcus halophilus (strain DSM 20338 / JCM 20259 / NCIMB 9735 / NBRC 12172) TaxID=945021 RepID=A0AAN1SFF2_TETHN|nr:multiple monosaccharide ABC transporter permease [Tetragenococcus halophilus]MCO7027348.1 sugar ABC transporter permease [Tetragenococcus halophilus]BAK93762.1 sugar ABC transporter permease protein [Tetragenococcus halophilus NBRC 12172]GBD71572.1 sugar ABC transporter permease protein [Tetragenococcus halophilus subsp. halophilus]GBD80980.1 Sugar ABC transporter permease protein [Tetragenococcus halophilus subsp. halophilus]GBD82976.1 sugar ABC transporter permease protein [Tetragenococcu